MQECMKLKLHYCALRLYVQPLCKRLCPNRISADESTAKSTLRLRLHGNVFDLICNFLVAFAPSVYMKTAKTIRKQMFLKTASKVDCLKMQLYHSHLNERKRCRFVWRQEDSCPW